MELTSVVLPMPLRPSSASDSPSASVREISDSTIASPYPALRRSIARSSGIEGLAEIDRLDSRIARHRVGLALDEERAVDQHRDAGREGEDDVHVVLDQQHGNVLGQT